MKKLFATVPKDSSDSFWLFDGAWLLVIIWILSQYLVGIHCKLWYLTLWIIPTVILYQTLGTTASWFWAATTLHWTAHICHWHIDVIFVWTRCVSVHWHQGKFQLWVDCFMYWMLASNCWPQSLRGNSATHCCVEHANYSAMTHQSETDWH